MRYTIRPVIDTPDWLSVPSLSLSHILWEPDCGIRAGGQFCHDGNRLYVRLYAREKEIRAEYTKTPSPVWEDSCLEFFFIPDHGNRYFNFEINPNGCLWIAVGTCRQDRENLCREDAESFFGVRTARTADGWEASWSIPLAFLRQFCPEAAFAGEWRANVYKCGDKTVRPHYLSWNPVTSAAPDFHRPQDFGVMDFA